MGHGSNPSSGQIIYVMIIGGHALQYIALVSEAQASTPDSTIDTFPPTITEVYKAMNKIKAGKAPGVCGISIK